MYLVLGINTYLRYNKSVKYKTNEFYKGEIGMMLMENVQSLKTQLRCHFFELVSRISTYSEEEIIQSFIDQLGETLNINCRLLLYNEWSLTYSIIGRDIGLAPNKQHAFEKNEVIRETIELYNTNMKEANKKGMFTKTYEDIKFFIVPLNNKKSTNDLLVLELDTSDTTSEFIKVIKTETEQFIKVINTYTNSQICNEKKSFLNEISSNLYSATNLTIILKKLTESIKDLYPSFTYLILLSQDYENDSDLPIKSLEYSDDVVKQVSMKSFTTGEVQLNHEQNGMNLYVPLLGSQGVYGVLQIIAPEIVNFPDNEIKFLTEFATIAGNAIENSILYRTSKHMVSDLKLINKVTRKLNSNLQLSEIITIIKNEVLSLSEKSQVGFIYFNEGSKQEYDILDRSTAYFMSEQGCSFVNDITERMIANKRAIFSGNYRNKYRQLPYQSVMIIPMLNDGIMLGLVIIMHEKSSFFSFAQFKLMESLIEHSALALTNAILKEQLEESVITDYMTKLYSRKFLDERIHAHMMRDSQGTLVLFDIDDFKSINDTYGHHIGDEVIIQTANIIKRFSREIDIPTRWGGEEIAVYLPHANLEAGVKLAGRIRRKVAEQTSPRVTLSSGVAVWRSSKKDSVTDLFIRADQALYKAKRKGKNRVVTEEGELI